MIKTASNALKRCKPRKSITKRQRRYKHNKQNKAATIVRLFDQVARKLSIQVLDDCYELSRESVSEVGGADVTKVYGSVEQIVTSLFPYYTWYTWKFKSYTRLTDLVTQRECFDNVAESLGVKVLDDFYKLSYEDMPERGLRVLQMYEKSLSQTLQSLYPHWRWELWRFKAVPNRCWHDVINQRQKFNLIAKELNIKSLAGWYGASRRSVVISGGGAILSNHYSSLPEAIKNIYPDYSWDDKKFAIASDSQEIAKSKRKHKFDHAAIELNINNFYDWYFISREQLELVGLYPTIRRNYDGCLQNALRDIYPQNKWHSWMFMLKNHKGTTLVESMGENLRISNLSNWYLVTDESLAPFTWDRIHKELGCTFDVLLSREYPNYKWKNKRFMFSNHASSSALAKHEIAYHKKFFNFLGEKMVYKTLDDWYRASFRCLKSKGLPKILKRYGGSLLKTLTSIYPTHNWMPWKFNVTPQTYWSDTANVKTFLQQVSSALDISKPKDWYRVSKVEVQMLGGGTGVLKRWPQVLNIIHPEYDWTNSDYRMKKTSQRSLRTLSHSLFASS